MAAAEAGTERGGKAPLEMPEAAVLRLSEKAAEPMPQPPAAAPPPPPLPPARLPPAQGNRTQTEVPRVAAAPVKPEELIGGGGRHWRSEGGSFCSSQKNTMNVILRGRGQRTVVPKRSRSPDRDEVIGRKGAASSADVAEERKGRRDWAAAAAEQEQEGRREVPSLPKELELKAQLPQGSGPSALWTAAEEQRRNVKQQQEGVLLPWHCLSGDASVEQVHHERRKQVSPVANEEPHQDPLLLPVPGPSAPGTAAREQEQQGALGSPATVKEPQQQPVRLKSDPAAQGTAVAESEPPLREPLGRFLPGVGGKLLFLGPVQ